MNFHLVPSLAKIQDPKPGNQVDKLNMDDKEDFDADRSIQNKQWLQSHYVQHPTECIRVVLIKAVLQQWLLNPINTVKIISLYFSDVLAKDSDNITMAQLVFYQAKACL